MKTTGMKSCSLSMQAQERIELLSESIPPKRTPTYYHYFTNSRTENAWEIHEYDMIRVEWIIAVRNTCDDEATSHPEMAVSSWGLPLDIDR